MRCCHSACSETDVTLCVLCLCVHVCVLPLTVGTLTCLEMGRGFDGVCVFVCVGERERGWINGLKLEINPTLFAQKYSHYQIL